MINARTHTHTHTRTHTHTYTYIYMCVCVCVCVSQLIGLMSRGFANSPGGLGSIPGCVIPKTFKMVLDTSLLNPQQFKIRIKCKNGIIQGKE